MWRSIWAIQAWAWARSFRTVGDVAANGASTQRDASQAPHASTDRDVYWFVGGPLDGRVQTWPAAHPAPTTVRYVHLHDGPKIVSYYDLHEVAGHGGEYRLRVEDPAPRPDSG